MDKLSVIILSLVFLIVCLIIIIIICISIRNEPINRRVDDFKKLLKHWNPISQKYDIPYSLAYGSLLGCYRNNKIIPYDNDVDIFIDGKGIDNILSINQDWCIFNTDISKYDWKIGDIKLIINKFHNEKYFNGKRKRFNCDGKEVQYQIDACSFNSLFARLVYKKSYKKYIFIDIYAYNIQKNSDKSHQLKKENNGQEVFGNHLTYIKSKYHSPLPPLKKTYFEGIPTFIFKDSKSFLERKYGKNFLIPNKKWNGIRWVP